MNDGVTERPIPEARGPHLPDVLTRQSIWVFVFGLAAVFILWSVWRRWTAEYTIVDLNAVSALLFGLIPGVVAPLFGVALFARHPDARRTMPLLVFGVALFAFAELLEVFDRAIFEALIAFTPEDFGPATPAVVAFGVFTALLGMFAVLYTGAGLSSARRRERSAAERPLMIWLVALGVVSAVVSIASIVPLINGTPTPVDLLQLGISLTVSLLVTLAWAYLVTVTVGGWLSDDAPRRAWALAALATSVLFAVRLAIGAVLGPGELWFTIVNIARYASLVAWVVLLVAFWLGLPSLDPTADPPEATQPGSAAG
jgi:uncharacterized membrane protein YidH (DUF202 family)